MTEAFNRYKDISPEETIKRNRSILETLGLIVEEHFTQQTDNIWSGWLYMPTVDWCVNGKGSTELYCKASAYGEALERLENFAPITSKMEYVLESKDFPYLLYKDEKSISIEEVRDNLPNVWKDLYDAYKLDNTNGSEEDLLSFLKKDFDDNATAIGFYDVSSCAVKYLPIDILQMLTGTNGMCSGNTPDEALVQGLSEICERYVEHVIYDNNLTPPVIDKSYIEKQYPFIYSLMKEVSFKSGYDLEFYDCSLGKGLPVVCLGIFDVKTQRYRLQYGAHPKMSIALERCLTELLQGYDLKDMDDDSIMMSYFCTEDQNKATSLSNYFNRFILGNGNAPDSFFYKKSSWDFIDWSLDEDYSNLNGVRYILRICKSLGSDVYIRDNGFLGIPAYYIYATGMSPYKCAIGEHVTSLSTPNHMISNMSLYCNDFSLEAKKELIDYLLMDDFKYRNISRSDRYFKQISPKTILAALYKDISRYDEAIKTLNSFPTNEYRHYAVAKDIELSMQNVSIENRDALISRFYGEDALTFVKRFWRTDDTIRQFFTYEEGEFDEDQVYCSIEDITFNINLLLNCMRSVQQEIEVDQNDIGFFV